MTLRTKVAEALLVELREQSATIEDDAERAAPVQHVKVDGSIDLEALADAALEARKRWHRATDPGAK